MILCGVRSMRHDSVRPFEKPHRQIPYGYHRVRREYLPARPLTRSPAYPSTYPRCTGSFGSSGPTESTFASFVLVACWDLDFKRTQFAFAIASSNEQFVLQTTPEPEAPLENNVARDTTTESSEETVKVTPPPVLTEVPASPPIAPAITEDVASVAKVFLRLS